MILTTHTHADFQNHGSKIISSNNSHFKVSNLDIMTAGSNNSKSSDIELGASNIESSVKLNQASTNSDVFSFYNFELATPKNKANESELDKSNNEQFNENYPADINSIQNNDIHISSTPPSILE